MIGKFKALIYLFLLLSFFHANAQITTNFHILNMNNGMSDNTIFSIARDNCGFMWFGSSNGLNRYDGENIRTFKLSDNINMSVNRVIPVDNDCLLVLSHGNLYLFNKKTETFKKVEDKHSIKNIVLDNKKNCWAVNNGELVFIDCSNVDKLLYNKWQTIDYDEKFIRALCFDSLSNSLFAATNRGNIIRYDCQKNKISSLCNISVKAPYYIHGLFYDKNRLWVSTIGDGLYCYDIVSGKVEHIVYNKGLSHNDVHQVLSIDDARYLVLTWNGGNIISVSDGKLESTSLGADSYNGQYIENRFISAYYDKQDDMLWIGTEGGGLLFSDLSKNFYKRYVQDRANEIININIDKNNYVWLNTFHRGIMCSTEPFNKNKQLDFKEVYFPGRGNRLAMFCFMDSCGVQWVGTDNGIVMRKKDNEWKSLSVNNDSVVILSILPVSVDEGWIGTDRGLYRVNWRNMDCEYIRISDNSMYNNCYIRTIYRSSSKSLWLGTSNGLIKLNIADDGKTVESINTGFENNCARPIYNKDVRTIYKENDNLWIGYGGDGLALLSLDKDSIVSNYTTTNGLCSNFITSIAEDCDGNLWIGSNSGISKLSKSLKSFYNYYISGSNRSMLWANNTLFVGSNNMLTYFDPKEINKGKLNKKVFFTKLEINNQNVNVNDTINTQVVLSKALGYTDSIRLKHDNRNFTISFTDLDYTKKQKKYVYRLYPYQKRWIEINGIGKVSYDNLPPGHYTFQVKNIMEDNLEGEMSSIDILIEPHWSETVWFFILLITFSIIILFLIFRSVYMTEKRKRYRLKLEHELYKSNMERNKEIELRKERESFFTATAHELRTPLTLIISPLQEILSKNIVSDVIRDRLSLVLKNAKSLQIKADRLLFLQKLEAGMVKLNITEVNVNSLLDELVRNFSVLSNKLNISLKYNCSDEKCLVFGDLEKITSVIENLISNALKYTHKDGGEVDVTLRRTVVDEINYVCIDVADNGCGIDDEVKEKVFDSFATGNNSPLFSSSIGFGLKIVKSVVELHHGRIEVHSQKGKGSKFSVCLPVGKDHLSGEYHISDKNVECDVPGMEEVYIETEGLNSGKYKFSVLIVEDNDEMRRYISSLFSDSYRVIQAKDGKEGLELAIKHSPDIIISDIMMPVMDGIEMCSEIHNNKSIAHVPVILLTACAEDEDNIKATEVGADDFLRKPFNPEVLTAKAENLLKKRLQLKQIYTKVFMSGSDSVHENKNDEDIFMKRVTNCIEANISDCNFGVKNLAEMLNMSQATFYRKLKQHTDLSAADLIRNIRMAKAAFLLTNDSCSVIEVAEKTGFNDVSTFRKHFMDTFGTSPSSYRNNVKKE